MDWARELVRIAKERLIAVDGKTLRGSTHEVSGLKARHLASTWCRENRVVLGGCRPWCAATGAWRTAFTGAWRSALMKPAGLPSRHGAENFSRLCRIALNLLKAEKSVKVGIAIKRLNCGRDNNFLIKVLMDLG